MNFQDIQDTFEALLNQSTIHQGRVSHQLFAGQIGRVALNQPAGQVSAVQARAWGEIRPGQACLVCQDSAGDWHALPTEGTQLVRRRVVSYRHSLPAVVASRGPIKILYTISRDSNWEFWIGGDSSPRKVYSIPWIEEGFATLPTLARLTNTGVGLDDWIIYIDLSRVDINSIDFSQIGKLDSSYPSQYWSIFVITPDEVYELTDFDGGNSGGGGAA